MVPNKNFKSSLDTVPLTNSSHSLYEQKSPISSSPPLPSMLSLSGPEVCEIKFFSPCHCTHLHYNEYIAVPSLALLTTTLWQILMNKVLYPVNLYKEIFPSYL